MLLGAYLVHFSIIVLANAQYVPLPRWGQTAALLENTLYVHGGLTDPFNTYSYSSAPPIAEVLSLDLSTSFDANSPPWQLLSNSTTSASSPAVAWHSLSAFNTTTLLLFGGQPGPNSQTVLTTLNNSAMLVSAFDRTEPVFLTEPQNWASQPMRRMRYSASSTDGKIWIIGGEEADGSGNAFSDHYVFDPFSLEFILLPSVNAPPGIFGHVSLILPDGKLVVFGGVCPSCGGDLVPLNTIWSLDTTQENLIWNPLSIDGNSLPSSRRDFAAVVLDNGNVLIQGGGDAQLENTFSDGWILNTNQNPMVWQPVAALEQIGARKDHFAVQIAGQVIFGFGYGTSSPFRSSSTNSAPLQVYNSTSSAIVPSYSAPPAGSTPAINSLPLPSQSGGASTGAGNGATQIPKVSPTSAASPSNTTKHTTAIALGAMFGLLGLVAGGVITVWCIRRHRRRYSQQDGRFFLLGGDLDEGGEHSGNHALDSRKEKRFGDSGTTWLRPGILAAIGLRRTRQSPAQPRERRDMLADEDTRQFEWGVRPSMMRREGSAGTGLSGWSFRSMSAMVRGVVSREPSGTGDEWDAWEKVDVVRESDRDGLLPVHKSGTHSIPETNLGRREGSSWSYVDPFDDPADDDYADFDIRPGEEDNEYDHYRLDEQNSDDDPPRIRPLKTLLPLSVPLRALSPLRETSRDTGTFDSDPSSSLVSGSRSSQGHSSQDHSTGIFSARPASFTQTSYCPTTSRVSYTPSSGLDPTQRRSSILDSPPSVSQPIRRSDSWWARFARSPLLERRTSGASERVLDFRDPNPAPKLVAIEEASKKSPESPESKSGLSGGHGHSLSASVHSGRTADTAVAERLGGKYDVVQRVASDGSGSRRTASFGSADTGVHGVLTVGSSISSAQSKSQIAGSPSTPPHQTGMSTPSATPPHPPTPPLNTRRHTSGGGVVSSRVQAYERRMSQDCKDGQTSPQPRNTRKFDEAPSRNRVSIKYGLAPRASLYVANPDDGGIS
ncbi:hypothetical protein BJ138DRAFT_1145234 [Hygrophoropsis aurantiaca]|uniref:Uncharacterized protein n=1 Tax=Hygrophoropsis aurantiaca TaxID=72124 RepID=A0ACB8ALI2_9AGAM|nr:hypothetical protein BJ138DRAFT_1145234 [Hygrophoropsis aurantiaca]